MFRAFYLSSEYGRSKVEKILLTYQTFVLSQKVHTPYATHPPLHNCMARLGEAGRTLSQPETNDTDATAAPGST